MARTTGLYRSALVALQVALSVVLGFGTGLMLRSLDRLLRIDPGFGKASALTFRVDLLAAHYPTRDDVVISARRLLASLESLPGVERAAAVRALPLASDMGDWGVGIEGYEMRSEQPPSAEWQAASPGYFEALGIPLLDGRTFEPRDDETGQPVIVVNQEFVRRYLGTGPVLGRRMVVYGTDPPVLSTLVGVVGDVRHVGLTSEPKPTFYLPHAQFARSAGFPIRSLTVVLQVPAGDRAARELLPAARRSVAAFDPRMPVFDAKTLDEVLAGTVSQPRLSTALLSFFALAALLLASLGIGGVVAHAVARRRRELGIRLAVGARPRDAIRHVFAGGAAVVGAGLLLGVAGGVLAGRALRGLLYGVAPLDAPTLVLTLALLGLVGMVACWLPARRAARVDPTRVLRQE
jgi:predicted permease